MELLNLFTKGGYKMLNTFQTLIITLPLITFSFAQPECQTYYADIDGDGDGAKSVWCSFTELPHATGGNWEDAGWETNGCGTVGWQGDTPAGHLTYGPYISSDPGLTHVTWNMLANGDVENDETQIATIDIFDATSNELLAWQNINVNDFNGSMVWQDFSLSYYSSPDHIYEFRTWYTGIGGHLVLRYITHINVDADGQGAYETTELCDGDDTSGWSLNTDDLMPLCAGNANDACWDDCGIWGGSGPEANHDCTGNCMVELDCTGNCCVLGEDGCYWQETGPCGEEGLSNGMDSCGVCGGDNSSCADCAGVPCSDAYEDNCGVCDDNPSNDCIQDCAGTWGGENYYVYGDANEDEAINVVDLVVIVDWILLDIYPENALCLADYNTDGVVNIFDILSIRDYIINR